VIEDTPVILHEKEKKGRSTEPMLSSARWKERRPRGRRGGEGAGGENSFLLCLEKKEERGKEDGAAQS